jgi:hypothetical protein
VAIVAVADGCSLVGFSCCVLSLSLSLTHTHTY